MLVHKEAKKSAANEENPSLTSLNSFNQGCILPLPLPLKHSACLPAF